MSTSKTYQQSLADDGSETRPPMLERGSYIPWARRFRRYINRKRKNQKWLNKALDEGTDISKITRKQSKRGKHEHEKRKSTKEARDSKPKPEKVKLQSKNPKTSHDDGSKPSSDDGKKVDEDPRKDSECNDQEKEDNVNITNNVNAASTNEVNAVGGKTSIELPFDPNMPALEDYSIFDFSRNDEDDGAMADMNNLDTTIQVSPIPTTRIHKDHPLDQVIRDLQSATQTRKMSKNLKEHGTQKGNSCIEGSKLDRGYAGRASTIQVIRNEFYERYSHSFLGLQVQQKKDGIFISQDKYVEEILKKFGLQKSRLQAHQWKLKSLCSRMKMVKKWIVHNCKKVNDLFIDVSTSSRPDKFNIMADSGCKFHNKAEYVAASKLLWTSAWIQNQLLDYGARVDSSGDKEILGEDASKQGRINAIDADDDITLVSVQDDADKEMFNVDALNGEDGVCITLKQLKTLKPKVKGIAFQEPSITTTSSQQSQDKGKGIMIEEHVKPMKKKVQIMLDEEVALKLQAEFDEEERLIREKAAKEKEPFIALIETWDDIQEKIDVDYQLAKRLQAKEQEELFDAEKAILFQQLLEKGRSILQLKSKREKKQTNNKAQQKKIMWEDLKPLYKLVKPKYESIRPVEDMNLLLLGDLKICLNLMLKIHYGEIRTRLQSIGLEAVRLFGSHSLRMQHVHIHMLVEKKYPLIPSTLSMMLEKKLQIDYESEMAYQLLKFIFRVGFVEINSLLDAVRITAAQVYVNTTLMKLVLLMNFKENKLSSITLAVQKLMLLVKVTTASTKTA
ncbi:hypothetical protein Tco_0559203 [Tanacetum coccineum]